MAYLNLTSLTCVATEDYFDDECRLEIRLDGALIDTLKKGMGDGDTWSIGRRYRFASTAEIRLWDEDWPDRDDWLGSVAIGPTNQPNGTDRFNRDGANYVVIYSVEEETPPVDPGQTVEEALADFEASALTGVWPKLDKTKILQEMRARIAAPHLIHQMEAPFCGPAAIAFELVRRQPRRYVEICRALFETGQFTARYRRVAAPAGLRGYPAVSWGAPTARTIARWRMSTGCCSQRCAGTRTSLSQSTKIPVACRG